MKTVYHYLIVVLALSWSLKPVAQATNGVVANNGYNLNGYLGWNNTSGFNPLFFKTNAINRMKLNGLYTSGTNQYPIDGFTFGLTPTNINTSGYLLLGQEQQNGNFFNTKGAFSMLHLNGNKGTFIQELGYRPWMRTGITFTDNQDLSYFGLRQVGTGFDITETTMTWADNPSVGTVGPDDFVFRFTAVRLKTLSHLSTNQLSAKNTPFQATWRRLIKINPGEVVKKFVGLRGLKLLVRIKKWGASSFRNFLSRFLSTKFIIRRRL